MREASRVTALDYRGRPQGRRCDRGAMLAGDEVTVDAWPAPSTATRCNSFGDNTFDARRVGSAEHIWDDERAIVEIVRVLRPVGVAATVPTRSARRVSWRSTTTTTTLAACASTGSAISRGSNAGSSCAAHHAHALHSPYWWLKCAYGLRNRSRTGEALPRVPRRTHRAQPALGGRAERALNPILGKSLVVYGEGSPAMARYGKAQP
jgi:hypothetical protein